MILMIDNYDSFTYNVVHYLAELGADVKVVRNDQISIEQALDLSPEKIVISPGPCTPNEAGVSCEVIREFGPKIPVLGVCLGHQSIGHVFGGNVVRAERLMHGKVSPVNHNGTGLFKGLPNPVTATRYHSLIVDRDSLPDCLEIVAETEELEVMALQHREFPICGVQFHPESILTDHGMQMLQNFLEL